MANEKTIFDTVQMKRPGYSAFNLSHEKKMSFNMGELIPCLIEEVVPGDYFKCETEHLIRLAPLIAPVMHRINVFVHYFFVPNRILWNQWEDFITGGRLGTTTPTMPTLEVIDVHRQPGTLLDYLGVPATGNDSLGAMEISALPVWAYYQIYNDYYRDANLADEFPLPTSSADANILTRAWEKDYFTSALPFPQRGPEVNIPIDASFTPQYFDVSVAIRGGTVGTGVDPGDLRTIGGAGALHDVTGNPARIENLLPNQQIEGINTTINDLRRSSALQRWLERQARGGGRYIETILSQFGVKSSDARLQRAEYLGGGKSPITISEVLNTSATATEPQGNMSGHGIATGTTNKMRYRAEEHGYIIGIISVLPRTAYQQGLPKHFQRFDKLDYYWPEFANLGEQEVKSKELYYTGDPEQDELTFGYQQRYAEYKYAMDTVHGDFKTTLDFWHEGRIFTSRPVLNTSFTNANPANRIFAVQDSTDKLWVQIYNHVQARRPMPYFADPRLT